MLALSIHSLKGVIMLRFYIYIYQGCLVRTTAMSDDVKTVFNKCLNERVGFLKMIVVFFKPFCRMYGTWFLYYSVRYYTAIQT